MSETRGSGESEALFSFELIVDFVQMNKDVGDELAVAVRLLDFPTLLIHPGERTGPGCKRSERTGTGVEPSGGHRLPMARGNNVPWHNTGCIQCERGRLGQVGFNRGKCCFFRMNPDSLNAQLSNAPVHVMVLDVQEEVPRLEGTALLSLAEVVDRLRRDLEDQCPAAASAHGQRGLVEVRSLTGNQVGIMSLSYKLLHLGEGLVTHGTDGRTQEHGERCVEVEETHKGSPEETRPTNEEEEKRTLQVPDVCQDEDLSVFCPPRLYYNNSAEERRRYEDDYKALKLDSQVLTRENSGDETEERNRSTGTGHKQRHNLEGPNKKQHQQMSEAVPNVLGDTLHHLPVLNALLVELSQLNIQNQDQTNAPRTQETQPKTRGDTRSPEVRDGSALEPRSESQTQRPAQTHTRTSSRSPRKTLVYGTTKTFNLRLKRVSPVLKRRACVDLINNKTTTEKVKSGPKVTESSHRTRNQRQNLNQHVETMVQRVPAETGPHRTSTRTPAGPDPGTHRRFSGSPSPSERTLVDTDGIAADNKHHSRSHRFRSESDRFRRPGSGLESGPHGTSTRTPAGPQLGPDRRSSGSPSPSERFRRPSSRSSRTRSPESSTSASSRSHDDDSDDGDYADDFNSLGPSDALSSPESWRAKTPRLPLTCPDSDPDSVQRRLGLPEPIKAPGSPQRVLRTTQTIQTQNQALSLSSEDADGRVSASLQTGHSGKRMQSPDERSSGPGSLRSRSGRSDLTEHSSGQGSPCGRGSAGGQGSPESGSFVDHQEAVDGVGSLDLTKGYRHVSELVVNKLPGYTM